MASKRDTLLAQIADLKETRNLMCLRYGKEDDVAAGQDHPEVKALEERIKALRDEVEALDEED